MPDPHRSGTGSLSDTRIDLPVTATPICRLNIDGRCLLALQSLQYPWDDWKTGKTGSVTLTGRINPTGSVSDIHFEKTPQNVVVDGDLVNASIKNLKTWKFERSIRTTELQINISLLVERLSKI